MQLARSSSEGCLSIRVCNGFELILRNVGDYKVFAGKITQHSMWYAAAVRRIVARGFPLFG